MKKGFKIYAFVWAVFVVLFHAVCFTIPNETAGITKSDSNFLTGLVFIDLAFVGQLVCAYLGLKEEEIKKQFYNLSLITISYTGFILMLAAGTIAMVIPDVPNWIGVIVCMLILAFTVVSVINAKAVADIVGRTDEKIKTKTLYIKSLTVDAERLMASAKSNEIKEMTKQVYEKVRYSDPMSDDALTDVESQITLKFADFSDAVIKEDANAAKKLSGELMILIEDRNRKCKLLK